jgi:hypothetical protein
MDAKMEKDADSMVVKPVEYAASEYSSSSEPPPAYKLRQANSVKIAKIVAFTVILSSFILGSFLLASTYLQAKATCDQVSALDAILDKELMLETMQQDLPRSEALLSREINENVVQDLSKDEMHKPNKKDEINHDDVEDINAEQVEDEANDVDSEMKRVHIKMPLEFDLSELAHNIMMNNQKSRMNCVVERRRSEEVEEPKPMNPFAAFMNEPKKEKITGERIAIFCETGAPKEEEPVVQIRRIVMPFPFPPQMHRFGPQMGPGPMGPQFQGQPMRPNFNGPQFPPQFNPQNQMNMPPQFNGPQFPPQFNPQNQMNMPPQMGPTFPGQFNPQSQMPPQMHFQQQPPQMHPQPQMRIPFPEQAIRFPQQQLPPIPEQQMSPPRPEVPQFRLISPAPQQQQPPRFERPQQQEVEQSDNQPEFRIQLRRIELPGSIQNIFPFLNNIRNAENEAETPRQNVQVQQMPLAIALSKVGITPDDLKNIQRMAEARFEEHVRELMAEDSDDSSDSDSIQSEEETDKVPTAAPEDSSEETQKTEVDKPELHEATSQQQEEQSGEQQILALGRSNFGRSMKPVQLPDHMTENTEIHEAAADRVERAAFVQPR